MMAVCIGKSLNIAIVPYPVLNQNGLVGFIATRGRAPVLRV